jgi:DNA-binding NtrC family response regulator
MPAKPYILLVGENARDLREWRAGLRSLGYSVETAGTREEAMELMEIERYGLLLVDLAMSRSAGIDLLRHARGRFPRMPVKVLVDAGQEPLGRAALLLGASDWLARPATLERLGPWLEREETARKRPGEAPAPSRDASCLGEEGEAELDLLLGKSPRMREVYRTVEPVLRSSVPVLLQGESGTGKDRMARFIHDRGERRGQPFLVVNCAAIPETLLESELFGHEKGAFTGAVAQRKGKLEEAHGGSVYLDEISELTLGLQAKILRVTEQKAFNRVGSNEDIHADVRMIVSTNRNLQEEVARGRFRGDLYFRLSVFPVSLPPLRERGEDIPGLARWFLERACRERKRPPLEVSPEALERLARYDWPGNIRELQNCIQRGVLLVGDGVVLGAAQIHFLYGDQEVRGGRFRSMVGDDPDKGAPEESKEPVSVDIPDDLREFLSSIRKGSGVKIRDMEKALIAYTLRMTGNNVAKASRILGISRVGLYRKMDKSMIKNDISYQKQTIV